MTNSVKQAAAWALVSLSMVSAAQAQDAAASAGNPPWTVTGNASLVSQYLFRGITLTQGKPTVQAAVETAHASGFYAGLWGSGVSHAAYNNGSGSEIDLYGGWRKDLGNGYGLDTGVYAYWYPGAYYSVDNRRIKYDSGEAKLVLSKDAFNVAGWVAVSKHFAGLAINPNTGEEQSTRGTMYFEVNWNPELAPGWNLNLHAGRQNVRHLGDYSFTDVRAGLTYTLESWQFSLAASRNNAKAEKSGVPLWTFFDADGRGEKVAGTRWVASVSKGF
ncbi:TorF family putative porin [Azohydromonas lata]|uniref:TorF family putative porin n=1 Tax=Azohydromonas lata TaxID=45677 RepID=A0ABU5IBG0_9BURK|nr:TorF family putative porin [Azohydromonas lata]MDZ5456189.1 TorF family putative porin [Azohydromonas lata]